LVKNRWFPKILAFRIRIIFKDEKTMKKCPTCEKTFEDSMRFCQTDGTLLVDDVESSEAVDPYQTIVAPSEPLSAPVEEPVEDPFKTVVATPAESSVADASGDLLQIPDPPDPLKTMYVSEDEIRREMAVEEPKEEPIFEVPPAVSEPEPPAPEPPSFVEPELNESGSGDMSPPASPFSTGDAPPSPYAAFDDAGSQSDDSGESATLIAPEAPIPSPFSGPAPPVSDPYTPPDYREPEPPPANPFDQPYAPSATSDPQGQMEWTPPPAPDAGWQNQPIGQNTPFQPPPAGGGLNQTLPIVSLVFGIISVCCYVSPLTGLVALITGFMGMKNANNDPNSYGGKGLAIAGMIVGGVFFILGLLYWLYIIFVVGLAALGSFGR
jgi:hypothetical protein